MGRLPDSLAGILLAGFGGAAIWLMLSYKPTGNGFQIVRTDIQVIPETVTLRPGGEVLVQLEVRPVSDNAKGLRMEGPSFFTFDSYLIEEVNTRYGGLYSQRLAIRLVASANAPPGV